MKNILIIILCFLSASLIKAQDRLTNIQSLTKDGRHNSKPQWSPDGSRIMFTTENNKGIYVLSLDKGSLKNVTDLPFVGYNATWEADGKSIVIQEKKKSDIDNSSYFQMKRLDINTGEILTTDKIAERQIVEARIAARNGRITDAQLVEVYIDANLQLVMIRDGQEINITNDEGQYYHPLISPDGTNVAVHKDSHIYVYSLVNLSQTPIDLGEGIASSWMPDGLSLLSFIDESLDGHTVTNSELYQVFIDAHKGNKPITQTKDVIEMWPSVSPDGKKVAFSDDKSGNIFIATLNN